MTQILPAVLIALIAWQVYLATVTERQRLRLEDWIDAGGTLPGWCFLFGATGVLIAGLGLHDHLLMTALYGLSASHVALGLIVAGLVSVLVQKRLWLAAEILRTRSPGDLLGSYYGSAALRTHCLVIATLFAIPFSAMALMRLGSVVDLATDGSISQTLAIWALAVGLFLSGVIGGWRGTIYAIAGQTLLLLTLIAFSGGLGLFISDGSFSPKLATIIPGVMQYSGGIGKGVVAGGIWTATAILSAALALAGIALSPNFGLLGTTARKGAGFAFGQVWMVAGMAAGLLLLVSPLMADGIGSGTGQASSFSALFGRLAEHGTMLAVAFAVLLCISLQIGIAFFAQSGASLLVTDLVGRFLLPEMTPAARILAARITLAVIFLGMALLASFAPVLAESLGTLAPSLSVQLLPAMIGLCWVRWISRGAVNAGMIIGILAVVFTEPFGLILFEGLFVELPWGRWPLTIHSAGWGLVLNLSICLLVAIFTHRAKGRNARDRLHHVFGQDYPQSFGGRAGRSARWSLVLIWVFLAIGPGAVLGNWFFARPVFSGESEALALPSLWVWQLAFWIVGVFLVWWLAYPTRMSIVDTSPHHRLKLLKDQPAFTPKSPAWMAKLLKRLA